MKISVVIPIYNSQEFLNRCLVSIVDQEYKDLDIILVDDGSTDASRMICKKFEAIDSRVKVIHEKNMGLSGARNTGISEAVGDYILFVDADDWLDTDYIQKCVNILKRKNVDLLFTSYTREYRNFPIQNSLFDQNEILFNANSMKTSILRRFFGECGRELRHPAKIDDLSPAWSKFYRASYCKKNSFVDTKIIGTEDAWFNINVINQMKSAYYFGGVQYHYNKENPQSLVTVYNRNKFPGRKKLYSLMKNFIGKNDLGKKFEQSLENRIIIDLMGLIRNVVASRMPFSTKINTVQDILNDPIYKPAFKKFNFTLVPFQWRTFFYLCQFKRARLVIFMIIFAEPIKKWAK